MSSSIQLRKIAFETIISIFNRRIRTLFPSIKLERRSHKIIEDPVRGQREREREFFFFVIDRFQIRFLAALNSLLHSSNLLSRRFSIHVIFLVRCYPVLRPGVRFLPGFGRKLGRGSSSGRAAIRYRAKYVFPQRIFFESKSFTFFTPFRFRIFLVLEKIKKNSSLYIEQHIHKYFNQEGVNSEKMQLSENYSSIIDRLVSIKREVSFEKT